MIVFWIRGWVFITRVVAWGLFGFAWVVCWQVVFCGFVCDFRGCLVGLLGLCGIR